MRHSTGDMDTQDRVIDGGVPICYIRSRISDLGPVHLAEATVRLPLNLSEERALGFATDEVACDVVAVPVPVILSKSEISAASRWLSNWKIVKWLNVCMTESWSTRYTASGPRLFRSLEPLAIV
ncbi:hypothetical protein [Microvirga massiliensis]|uniref:hypothetical protein n=1 Tax=Microvirga massiliensis TaxID=1033741 RepID=UPI0011C9FBF9|nr:hypothetical protein [Microvirga massiliensis]